MRKIKIIALLLTIIMLFCACAEKAQPAEAPESSVPVVTEAPIDTPEVTEAPAPSQAPETPEPTEEAEPEIEPEPEPLDSPEPIPEPEGTVEPTPAPTPTPEPEAEAEVQADPTPESTPEPAPESTPEPTPESAPEPTPEPTPEPAPEPTPEPEPYSQKTDDTVLSITGTALSREWYFTLAELQNLGCTYEGDYFSRGKEPQEMTTHFIGIELAPFFRDVLGLDSYKKAVFTSTDGYKCALGKSAVEMTYISEKDSSAQLPMILAWSEDDAAITLRLVMGQSIEGEYNRTNWVRSVCEVEIRAE